MSTPVTFNGSSYTVPAIADASWGANVSSYLVAIATGCLQKTGGSFTLAAEANFGATYGLLSPYYKSNGTNIAAAGAVRLAKTETLSWRNNANGADLPLGLDGSDNLTFNSVAIPTSSSSTTLTNKLLSDSTVKFANVSDATKLLMTSLGGATTGKTMTIVSSHTNNRSLTLPDATDTLVGLATTDTLTNKTLTSPILTTPNLGVATATSINKMAITAPATSSTLAVADGKTFTVSNTLTFTGTDSTSFAFPTGSSTVMTLSSADTITGVKSFNDGKLALNGSSSGTMTLKAPAAASTYVATFFAATDTVVGNSTAATLTNKVLSGNTAVTLISGSGTLTLNTTGTITVPNATDTLVGKATTDVLTNKTLSGNTAVTLISGSGTLTLNTTGTTTLPNATDTLMGKATTDIMTNKTATAMAVTGGSYINMLTQAAIRFNDDSGGDYVALSAPTGVTTYTLLLPATQGAASTNLQNDGSGNLSWVAAVSATLNQYNLDVGNASNSRTATNTNLIGDIQATTASQSYTVTSASPGVFTVATAPATGSKAYVTVTQNGFTASTTYYVTNVSGTTFKLATTLANAVAGTNITSSGTVAGVVVSGGLVLTSGVRGVATATTATAGYVGEVLSSGALGGAVNVGTGWTQLGTLTITPGNWLCFTTCTYNNGAAGNVWIASSFVTTTAAGGTPGTTQMGGALNSISASGFGGNANMVVPVTISTATAYYLNAILPSFASGSGGVAGQIIAVRIS